MTVKELRHLVDLAKANISEGNAPLHLLDSRTDTMGLKLNRHQLGELIISLAGRELDGEREVRNLRREINEENDKHFMESANAFRFSLSDYIERTER